MFTVQRARQSNGIIGQVSVLNVISFKLKENGRKLGKFFVGQRHALVVVIFAAQRFEGGPEGLGNSCIKVRVGSSGIDDEASGWNAQIFRFDIRILGRVVSIVAGAKVNVTDLHTEEPTTTGSSGRVDQGSVVQSRIHTTERHGTRDGAFSGRFGRPAETERKLLCFDLSILVQLLPVRRRGAFHSHDSVGQLCFEESRQTILATKGETRRKGAGVIGIPIAGIRIDLYKGGVVRSSDVAAVNGLVGMPRTSFLVAHTDIATILALLASASLTGIASDFFERAGISLNEIAVDMIFGGSTIFATAARKGGDAGSSIDNHRLTLRWGTAP
mmetsp:Transcript_52561/g.79765  ORF Transcript_52561/g.79765 Transcript_52561/m.79765 type:complete len:329 (-) Transcript_52561:277-1263(-)